MHRPSDTRSWSWFWVSQAGRVDCQTEPQLVGGGQVQNDESLSGGCNSQSPIESVRWVPRRHYKQAAPGPFTLSL